MFKKENNKSSSSKFKKWRKLQEKRRLEHEKAQHAGRYHPDPGLKMTNSIQKRRLFRKTIPLLTIFGLTALISLYSIMPISRLVSLDVSGGDKQADLTTMNRFFRYGPISQKLKNEFRIKSETSNRSNSASVDSIT